MPTYEITSPDGKKFRVSGEGTADEALAHFQQQYQRPPLTQSDPGEYDPKSAAFQQRYGKPPEELSSNPLAWLKGTGDAALAGVTGMGANIGNEAIAGATDFLRDGAQGEKTGNDVMRNPPIPSWVPHTPEGRAIGQFTSLAMEPITKPIAAATNWSADTDNPDPGVQATGHLAKALLGALSLRGGAKGVLPESKLRLADSPAMENARALALSLDPRQVIEGQHVGGVAQRLAATMGGKHAIPAEASLLNQPKVKAIVAEDLGLNPGETITPATIAKMRTTANKPYQALQNLQDTSRQPFRINLARDSDYLGSLRKVVADATKGVSGRVDPDISKLVNEWRPASSGVEVRGAMQDVANLREEVTKLYKSDEASSIPLARAKRAIANAIEDALDRQLTPRFPDLVSNWRTARTQLAKVHTVEDAMNGTEIDARLLAKAEDSGAKLSPRMAQIAQAARDFPTVLQAGAGLGNKASLGLLDTAMIGAGGGIGGLLSHSPELAALGAAAWPMARMAGKKYAIRPPSGPHMPGQWDEGARRLAEMLRGNE